MEERRTTGRDEDYRELKEVLSTAGVAWGSAMHGMLRQWRGGGGKLIRARHPRSGSDTGAQL
jgi:hypothetical protein